MMNNADEIITGNTMDVSSPKVYWHIKVNEAGEIAIHDFEDMQIAN